MGGDHCVSVVGDDVNKTLGHNWLVVPPDATAANSGEISRKLCNGGQKAGMGQKGHSRLSSSILS